jgi:PAS domain S-box-containing protein/putative nucleotidyltransferase with HDIG domain
MRWVTKAGEVRWLRDTACPEVDPETGRVVRVFGASQDITERKQAELAVLRSEDLFKCMFHRHAAVELLLEPGTGRILEANDAALKFYGWSRDAFSKMEIQEIDCTPADEYAKIVAQTKAKGHIHFETRHMLADGGTRDVEVFSSNITHSGGAVIHAIVHDVTARKKAETELRKREENFRQSLEHLPLGLCVVSEEGKTCFINQEALNIFGCRDIEEWRAVPIEQRYTRRSLTEHRLRREKRLLRKTLLPEYEVDIQRKDGEVRHLKVWRRPVLWDGKDRYLLIYRDITDVKRAQQRLLDAYDDLRKSLSAIVKVLVAAVEARDPYTAGHQERVANLAAAIAEEMGWPPAKVDGMRMAGSVHDIGKIAVPAEILAKPARVSAAEHALIQEHPRAGFMMLKDFESPWPLAEVVYQHHERMNGSGYPRGLKQDEILMEARILAVADVVEAIATHPPGPAARPSSPRSPAPRPIRRGSPPRSRRSARRAAPLRPATPMPPSGPWRWPGGRARR